MGEAAHHIVDERRFYEYNNKNNNHHSCSNCTSRIFEFIRKMKTIFLSLCLLVLVGCANKPNWHWDKPGTYQSDINADLGQCRAQALSGTGGYVTQGTVMIMYSCMEGKGYQRVPNTN